MKFWDMSLDHGENGSKAALVILKLLSMTIFSHRKCPVTECDEEIAEGTPACDHFVTEHLDSYIKLNPDTLTDSIINCDPENITDILHHSLSVMNHLPF